MALIICEEKRGDAVKRMQPSPEHKPSSDRGEKPRPSLALRLEHAADTLNPFLVLVVVGLVLLDVTLYIGLSVSREPYVWAPPRQSASAPAAAPANPAEAANPHR